MLDRHPEMLLKDNPDFERSPGFIALRNSKHKLSCSQSWQMSGFSKRRVLSIRPASPQPIVMQHQLFSFLVFDISLPSQSSKCSETLVLQRQTLLSWIALNGRSADLDSLERVFDRERLMSFPNPHTHIFCIFCSGTTVILIQKEMSHVVRVNQHQN